MQQRPSEMPPSFCRNLPKHDTVPPVTRRWWARSLNTTENNFFLNYFPFSLHCWLICPPRPAPAPFGSLFMIFMHWKKKCCHWLLICTWAWIVLPSLLDTVSTVRVDSLQRITALPPDPHAFLCSLGSAVLSQSFLISVHISPHVQTQAKIIENISLPPPESGPWTEMARLRAPPLLIRIKSHSLITQRREKAASHAKRL